MVIVAVSGCVHGHLDLLYETLSRLESERGVKVDVLLCTGDFQALRGNYDLPTLSCPAKYRALGDFHDYYNKRKFAPVLTIVIGGNHEAVLYMHAAKHGGWIAPNIYYLGRCGVVRYGSLKIAGISGIYHDSSYERPLPTKFKCERDFESLYRVRADDVEKICQISKPDIFLSHDWPQGIYNYGDTELLLRKKKFFRRSVEDGSLGSPANLEILEKIRP